MRRWRWISRFTLLFLLLLFSLTCYLRRGVVVGDPYWEVVVNWRNWQQRVVGLAYGRWLTFRRASEWTEAMQELGGVTASRVLFTPYWRNDLLDQPLPQGEDIVLISPSALPTDHAMRQVTVDVENVFRAAGEEVARFVAGQSERSRVVAYFYGGESYDVFAQAFSEAFQSTEGVLKLRRGFTSQWAQLEDQLQSLDVNRAVLVLALGELNSRALALFEEEDRLLFVTEDNRYPGYLKSKMLLSVERDYRGMFRASLMNRSAVSGYLYVPETSPLAERKSSWIRHDSRLWQRIVLLWN